MKQLHSDGKSLVVRDIGDPPLVQLEIVPGGLPLPLYHHEILEDEKARNICKELINKGYKRTI